MGNVLKTAPAVFAVGETYQIMVPVNCPCLMWVNVGGETFADESNGILRSDISVHRVIVPSELLDKAGKYTVVYRKIIERKPYFTESEEPVCFEFDFHPVRGDGVRAYHIADSHNMVDKPVEAYNTYVRHYGKIDFLILNGDIPTDSGSPENFDTIYRIADAITHGSIPIVYSRGNHDMRGLYADRVADYTPSENGKTYYTFRLGGIWGIILDCAEDKDDSDPEYGHTVMCHRFRKAQTDFIKKVVSNRETEYLSGGTDYKMVLCHVPFSTSNNSEEKFNIERDIYREWSSLLRENIHPDIMLCGHLHKLAVSKPGGEYDQLGLPCTLVIGSAIKYGKYFAGAGLEFSDGKIKTVFTDSDGEILGSYTV